MITRITLENFRAFNSEISVLLRPITVLIGRNSAGKSSLIKFLLLLKQSLESQSDSFFVTEGSHVQLGHWFENKNTQSKNRCFRYNIEFETHDLPGAEVRRLWSAIQKKRIVRETADMMVLHVEIEKDAIQQYNAHGSYTVGGEVRYHTKYRNGSQSVQCNIDDSQILNLLSARMKYEQFLRFTRRKDTIESILYSSIEDQFIDPIRNELLSLQHLSPIREESQQVVQAGSPPAGEVGHRGEYTIPHLARIFTKHELRSQAEFISRYACEVAGIDDIRFSSQIDKLLVQAKAKNRDTNADCSLANFGFGVSQCLPIFVQASMMVPNQLLIVEQPEAQLHPTAQMELGTFFANLWTTRKVPSIIETHSSNIILRIRKLVSKGELDPSDVSLVYFYIDDNNGKYTSNNDKSVDVKNIHINTDGSLQKGLPMEFFGADILEALNFGKDDDDGCDGN